MQPVAGPRPRTSRYNGVMNAQLSPFSAEELAACAPLAAACADIEVVDETASTNADLMVRLGVLRRPVCRLAHSQTAGRGRAGRGWMTSSHGALTFSVAWRFDRPLHSLTGLPLAAGVAVATVLQQHAADVRLKWPNDILRGGAKLGGILVETVHSGSAGNATWVVTGVGINLALSRDTRLCLGQPAADLSELPDEAVLPLAGSLLDELVKTFRHFNQEGFAAFATQWNLLHAFAGSPVDILDGARLLHTGKARGVDESGRFLLDNGNETVAIMSGDISLRVHREA